MTRANLTILFSGMLGGDPQQGGATWAVLQYLLGFRRLGHEVFFVEPVKEKALRPAGTPFAETEQAVYFRDVVLEFGLQGGAALLCEGTTQTVGLSYDELRGVARRADLLFNVSGMLAHEALLAPVRRRVYLDLDPAFVQLWHAAQGIDMRFGAHTHFITVGMNLGREECAVPTCGLEWLTTPQPVVLEHWPAAGAVAGPAERDAWTTVGNWRGYGSVTYDGVHYGQKAHSMRRLMELPARARGERLELALNIHPDEREDLAALARHGWRLIDPDEAAGTPARYRRFVQESRGELGVAKSGYVASHCGWFSDRSACYLASGRPVVAQQTGWGRWLPAGEGVLAFSSVEDAAAALEEVRRDYPRQARAARALAERHFDSDRVLSALLEKVGATP